MISLMVACAGYLLLSELRRPMDSSATSVEITVDQGDTTSAIATKLRAANLIRQPLMFTLLVRSQGLDGQLQAGRYVLRPNMTVSQIISALQTSRVEEVQVRLVEGLRIEEIAQVVGAAGLRNVDEQTFLKATRAGAAFKQQQALLSSLPEGASLEGYLFPDTYRFAATATVTEVVGIMLDNFASKYATFEKEVRVPSADVHKIVTMASIVQREAVRENEMPKIAAVFWNRLKPEYAAEFGGGQLGADPTVQYVLGQPGSWWPKLDTLSAEDINGAGKDGPLAAYNTRGNAGLPPGPISTPGLAALKAAAQPDESQPYVYFVASCSDKGAHNFAINNADFQRFSLEYQQCPVK